MRPYKAATALFMLVSIFFGASRAANATTPKQTLAAIHRNFDPDSLRDLDISTQDEIICAALNLYQEARGSSEADILAVGFTTRNRVRASISHKFCDSIWEKGQYVWTKRAVSGQLPKEKSSWSRMVDYARKIVTDVPMTDPTGGADSFYSRHIHCPSWARRSKIHIAIGDHIFVRTRASV